MIKISDFKSVIVSLALVSLLILLSEINCKTMSMIIFLDKYHQTFSAKTVKGLLLLALTARN